MGKLQNYTIMPLDTAHLDEICEDIRAQVENGVASCALFCMTLVPEGNPPVDKVGQLAAKYDLFRAKLAPLGVPTGILVQASIGHGWVLSEMFPYQRYTELMSGEETSVVCPYDEGFRAYIRNVLKTVAEHHPDHVMIDDDLRLIFRQGGGCACPLHLAAFNKRAGTKYDRKQLLDAIRKDTGEGRRMKEIFCETQRESLVDTAKAMREGMDSVDPALPGSYCCVGCNAEFAEDIAAVLAGKGNPIVIRINNGNYTPAGARYFSQVFLRAAASIAKLQGKADVILAETDTCPQNRYSTGAMSLHTHFTGTILEGAAGAKHWITRLSAHEPQSGKAYRRVLGAHRGFYQALADLAPTLRWMGCRIPVTAKREYTFREPWESFDGSSGWSLCVLERLGLPMYFSAQTGGATFLDGDADKLFDDGEIKELLAHPLFLASDTAKRLCERGFSEYLGVTAREWKGDTPTGEILKVNGNDTRMQKNAMELVPASDKTESLSVVYHSADKIHRTELFPGSTRYRNRLGGTVVTFCGTPKADFDIGAVFAFLNYSRKQQLIELLKQAGELPLYFPGDEEMYLRAAKTRDGGIFCAAFNIGLDPIEKLQLCSDQKINKIEKLMPDGTRERVAFTEEDGVMTLDCACNTLDPAVLFLY